MLSVQGFESAKVPIYWFNFFFTFLFSVEAVLKIIALHPVVCTACTYNVFICACNITHACVSLMKIVSLMKCL